MTEYNYPVDKAWFKDKLRQKGVSRREVAKLLGFDHSSFSRIILGTRRLTPEYAVAMAAYFEVSVHELLKRAGLSPPDDNNTLPVIGSLNGALEVTPRVLPPVASMPVFERDARCLLCDDRNSLYYGWIFAYIPAAEVQHEAIGRLSVVTLSTGLKLIRFLTPGLYAGRFNLMPMAGRQLNDVEISAATPVLHIRTAQAANPPPTSE
jgi:transcriptional regulator with XRE-family HTH domain